MSHYEERLEHDLDNIRRHILAMAGKVDDGIRNAVRALQTGDRILAAETILADHAINREMREIDRLCHAFIAVHLPSGIHLRMLSAAIRINIALERIGDYAVTIARTSEQLSEPPAGALARELERIANSAKTMLSQSIDAYKGLNAEMARATMVMEQDIEYDLESVYAELTENRDREKVRELLAVYVVLTHLKRVADQAKNLCEDIVFIVTGEGKAPKIYNILFLGKDNSGLSKMAELIARKAYPESGTYSSCGRNPAKALNPQMVSFLEQHGIDAGNQKPQSLEQMMHELVEKHVIVSLDGPVRKYIKKLPFHTTAVEWDVGPLPEGPVEEQAEQWESLYRDIATRVQDLVCILRGPEAH
ncbi:MAG: phosphate signaling complex protein PhoU [Gammaproteobacteria bacterium]|nr:phosphate signaling complex protein PhoU [Gammaproteobacteria bacterium]